jgi:hypothetical protein
MPLTPEYSAKLAELKQVKKDLSHALNTKNVEVVRTKYSEKKQLLGDLKESRTKNT